MICASSDILRCGPCNGAFLDIYTEKVTKMALSEKELIEIRRKLHQIPEIGMEEFETQKYFCQLLKNFHMIS